MNLKGVLIEDQKKDTLLFVGKVQVRITDWFFFKTKAEIKYAGLRDVIINLNRSDSVWNYQFITDYFSGGSSSGKKEGIQIDLKKLELRNISLIQKDTWRGEDLIVKLKALDLDAEELNLFTKKVNIRSIEFTGPLFHIKNYAGLRPVTTNAAEKNGKVQKNISDTLLKWNTAGWKVHVDKMKISDGIFKNEKQSETPYYSYFDGRNIDFSSINGNFKNINWIKDTATAYINLQTKERSGLVVKSMFTNMKFTPQGMYFDSLEIRTNKSILRNTFSMTFEDMRDFGSFLKKVRMNASFENSVIESDDIAFFAPELSSWKKRIEISGEYRGTVEDLFGNNMNIRFGGNTLLTGNMKLTGLPDIHKTFIDLQTNNFRTTYLDAVSVFPLLKSISAPRLEKITYINFSGNFTGFLLDFVAYGTIKTNLGNITSDLNMKLPKGKDLIYSGKISSDKFELGSFMNDAKLGSISFNAQLKGKGVKWDRLDADLDLTVDQVDYNNYHYENIKAKGVLNKKIFTGDFVINDTNMIFKLNGIVDLNKETPKFNFLADAEYINLKNLKLTDKDITLKGKFDFNFTGKNIDDFSGTARVTDAKLWNKGEELPLDSLVIYSVIEEGVKRLSVKTNELEGSISGNFSIEELPDAFKLFLNKYFPSYIKEPTTRISEQAFAFDIQTNYVDEFLKLFDSSLHGFNNSHISGKLNTLSNQMELSTDIPAFSYKNYEFQNVKLTGKGDMQKLQVTGIIDQLKVSDSLGFPYIRIDLVAQNDLSDIKIISLSNNKNITEGAINAQVKSYSDGFGLRFDSSYFILNGKHWSIEKNSDLAVRANQVTNGQIILKESNQEVNIKTIPSVKGNWNDIQIDLKNLNIGDVTRIFIRSNSIEGLATGSIRIEDPVNIFNVVADLNTDQLHLDKDSIGQLQSHISYENKSGRLIVTGKNQHPNEHLNYDLNLYIKDLATNGTDEITITPENYPIDIAERFIGTLFTDLQGKASGQLKIIGNGSNRKYEGKVKIKDAGLKVIFSQCYYKLTDSEINFREDALDLGSMKLIDTITKNTATLSRGLIKHDSWRKMVFDIRADVDNRPMQLLNTTARDNQSFYGNAKGTGSFSLTGPQSNMRMKITGIASRTDSSYLTIPNTSSRETGIADFLIERKYGTEMFDSSFNSNETNLTYDVDITGNQMVNVKVVMDELTNDEIRGRGEGNLRIISGTTEPLSIRGRYDINEGSYRFSFQSFFKKPFELRKDAGNYIEWNGDPYHPTVNIEAVYKTEKKVDFSPLINGANNSNTTAIRDYVYVIAKLKGDLFKPYITFALDFPPDSPPKKDLSVSFVVDQLQHNENELNKQVAFLVVFNSFAPTDAGSSLGISTGVDLVVNSISGFLSSQINKALNNILANKLKIPGFYVNFSGSLYNPNPIGTGGAGFSFDRTNLNLSVGKSFFDNRIILTYEGSYDVPFQSTQTQIKSDLLTNITTEFLINQSGTIRATIFYKENLDFLSGTATSGNSKLKRFGGSLAYRKEFNKLNDFFGKKKAVKKPVNSEIKKEEN